MKIRTLTTLVTAPCAILIATALPAHAATYYWDGTDTTANADGGNGTWNETLTNWDTAVTGGANTASGTNNILTFGGVAGTVNGTTGSATGPRLNGMDFTTSGYTITGQFRTANNSTFTTAASTTTTISATFDRNTKKTDITVGNNSTLSLDGNMLNAGTTTLTKLGNGTLLMNGASMNAGQVIVSAGAIGGTGSITGTLSLNAGSFHVVNLLDPLAVSGTVSIYSGFGVDDLLGIDWGSVADGTYTLIDGNLGAGVVAALNNNSVGTAYDLGSGRSAYFQEGSLELVVSTIPEPASLALMGLGLLLIAPRRR